MINVSDLVKDQRRIIIDTCALMDPNATHFFLVCLLPELHRNNLKVIIYSAVEIEIQKHAASSEIEKQRNAKNDEMILKTLSMLGRVEYIKRPGSYADKIIIQGIKDHNAG